MDFLFNFPNPINDGRNVEKCDSEESAFDCKNEICSSSLCEIVEQDTAHQLCVSKNSKVTLGSLEINHVFAPAFSAVAGNDKLILDDKSDIISGVYEGGMKIWECSLDLVQYLDENECIKNGAQVLELGCGAGLPGLLAFKKGASVTFQDFNAEVLRAVTIPNAWLNSANKSKQDVKEKCTFIKGDWEAMRNKLYLDTVEKKRFDIILTSETIYDKRSHKKLLDLMKCALKPSGEIYLAAKVHYFGVGGSLRDFEELVHEDRTFDVQTMHAVADGVKRTILRMKFKTDMDIG